MTDTSFITPIWESLCAAFGTLSRRYRPIVVYGKAVGLERFSLIRWQAECNHPEMVHGASLEEALAFLSERPLACESQISAYRQMALGTPVIALLNAVGIRGTQGTAIRGGSPSDGHTVAYVPYAADGLELPGWALGMQLTVLAADLLHSWALLAPLGHEGATYAPSELLRRAAGIVLEKEWSVLSRPNSVMRRSTGTLFLQLDRIAGLSYERRPLHGRLLFRQPDGPGGIASHPGLSASFSQRIPLCDAPAARKVLEMTGDGCLALGESVDCILGLAAVEDGPVPGSLDVSFSGARSWSASLGGRPEESARVLREPRTLFIVENGIPKAPVPVLAERDFLGWSQETFKGMEADHAALWSLAEAVRTAPHGALLVITPQAEREAERLGNRAIRLGPEKHQPAILKGLASVDGALLVDLHGRCHAAGVILDGTALERKEAGLEESPSRGSRFNSAVRYVASRRRAGVQVGAVVFSEDKMVDLLPEVEGEAVGR